jgi:hypothetical protein
MIRPLNLPPPSQHTYNLQLEPFAPLVGMNLLFKVKLSLMFMLDI